MDIVEALLKVALLGSSWILWSLLALSVVSFGVMAERIWFFGRNASRSGEGLRRRLLAALAADDPAGAERLLRDSGSIEGVCVSGAFRFAPGGSAAFHDALGAEFARARTQLDRGMNFLGTLGSNAPFVGLLGTVIGVIGAFHELGSSAARAGAMGGVMSAIAEALVATGVGLFVAIPAVVAYNMASRRIGAIERETLALGRLVAAWLEVHERGRSLAAEAVAHTEAPAPAAPPAPEPTGAVATAGE